MIYGQFHSRAHSSNWIEHLIPIQKVTGSNPVGRAIFYKDPLSKMDITGPS